MKLIHVLSLRLSVIKVVVFAFWAALFYFAVIDEINDEVDDSLEDHAETLIRRHLAGERLPSASNDTNNQYYLHEVPAAYADSRSHIRYEDSEVYIRQKNEFEPARTISYIFSDDDGRFFELMVYTPTIDKDDLKAAVAWWILALYAAMVLCTVAVNIVTLRRFMRPLQALLAWLGAYRIGGRNRPMPPQTDIDEFRQLGEAMERSFRRSEQAYEQQKLFTANASHEMQTPLAVIQSRLEMLLDDGGLTERQMGDVVKTLHTLQALARTNRSLLLLCKIDNGQFTNARPVSMEAVIGRLLADMQAVYAHKRIAVTTSADGDMTLTMDPSLASTLASNLLKNAFVHTCSGGSITISITPGAVTIANTGHDGPLDAQRIFERFYHSPQKASSTGLGLAIVKAICRLYGLGIAYSFEDGRHVFTLTPTDGQKSEPFRFLTLPDRAK